MVSVLFGNKHQVRLNTNKQKLIVLQYFIQTAFYLANTASTYLRTEKTNKRFKTYIFFQHVVIYPKELKES